MARGLFLPLLGGFPAPLAGWLGVTQRPGAGRMACEERRLFGCECSGANHRQCGMAHHQLDSAARQRADPRTLTALHQPREVLFEVAQVAVDAERLAGFADEGVEVLVARERAGLL